jgi:alanine racemase
VHGTCPYGRNGPVFGPIFAHPRAEVATRQAGCATYNPGMSDLASQRPTRIRVDLDALAHNLEAIRRHTQRPVMGIVKANAYGHGLVPVAKRLEAEGIEQLGVAFVEEGIALRRAGVRTPILVMGGVYGRQLQDFIAHELAITVSSIDKLRLAEAAAEAMGRQAIVHLKIDTGMNRIGVQSERCSPFLDAAFASPFCRVQGLYSHLACADDPSHPMTALQRERFLAVCAEAERYSARAGRPMPLRHLANSGGVLHHPDTWLDMVRPGIALYGALPDPSARDTVGLRPVLSLASRVVYFKVVRAGATVSYGATWAAAVDTRVITIPIGYGDGWPRALSSTGEVLVRGQRKSIVGRVCMDQFMVDLGPQGSAYNDDEVVLIGAQAGERISVEAVAEAAGTIPYEILTGLNERIPREYLGG